MARRKAVRPAELAGASKDWLSADLSHDVSAHYARLFAKALRDAVREREQGRSGSLRQISREAGVSHSTILAIIDGKTVPDLGTIALLEKALHAELLPTPRLPNAAREFPIVQP